MSRSLTVSRTLLSLADLQLWSPPNSFLVGDSFGPGPQIRRRERVTSPFVTGSFLTGSVRDTQQAQLLLEITGSSGADLSTRLGVVIDAFSQFTYTLAWNFDGLTAGYTCEAADYSVGQTGVLEDIDVAFHATRILFTIPHDPIPLLGSI